MKRMRTVGLTAYALVFTGLFIIMVSVVGSEIWHWPVWLTTFVRECGLLISAVIAGTILHEKLLRDEMYTQVLQEMERQLDAKVPKLDEVASRAATEVHKLFCATPPQMSGIRYLSNYRRGFSGYYRWVTEHHPQELFFAGRSVLHRIDADIRMNADGSAEAALLRCLQQNSRIKILLLDPRTNILERLAQEENQTLKAMLCDIVTSLGICRRLFDLLQNSFTHLEASAELTVRVYDRVPYFAYHKQNDEVIIGFYFQSTKGYASAVYEIVDEANKVFLATTLIASSRMPRMRPLWSLTALAGVPSLTGIFSRSLSTVCRFTFPKSESKSC